jgi:hypothetical protein
VIIGNSVASLVGVLELRRLGRDVVWIQDGTALDGIWRGFQYEGRTIDLGMINLELDLKHPNVSENLMTYDPYAINDCARFIHSISEFLKTITPIKELPKIQVFEHGKFFSDHLISNDFSDLVRYKEFAVKPKNPPESLHPRFKYSKEGQKTFAGLGYGDYVSIVYGDTLGKLLFLNWGRNLIGERVMFTNTLRHRAAWLPLPYPETIRTAASGKDHGYLSSKFHYPEHSTLSEMLCGLFDQLNNDESISKFQMKSMSRSMIEAFLRSKSLTLWGSKMETFLELIGYDVRFPVSRHRKTVNIDLYEVQVPEENNLYSVLNNDPTVLAWYRITLIPNVTLSNGNQVLVVESSEKFPEFDPIDFFKPFGLNIVKKIKSFEKIPAFLTLDYVDYESYKDWHMKITETFPTIELAGGSAFGYSATLNDQIVQGLKFVKQLNSNE